MGSCTDNIHSGIDKISKYDPLTSKLNDWTYDALGGAGPSNNAADEANRMEKERQAQIAAATGRINDIFDSPQRTSQYRQLADDTARFYQSQLDRQKAENDRKLRFALARSGQTGGSVQADQGRRLGEDFLRGVAEVNRRGQQAGAQLRASDEQSRANLIAMAQGGLDATTAASNSAAALRSNLASANASAQQAQLGDMFSNLSDLYDRSRQAKADRQGQLYAYNTIYQPGFGYGGSPWQM